MLSFHVYTNSSNCSQMETFPIFLLIHNHDMLCLSSSSAKSVFILYFFLMVILYKSWIFLWLLLIFLLCLINSAIVVDPVG